MKDWDLFLWPYQQAVSELEKQFNFTANKENTNQSKVQRAWEHKK